MITPAALSILTTTFAEGKERNAALGAWGAVGAFGAVAGVLLGGVLTDWLSWEWVFFVNMPVGVLGLVLAPILLTESRDARVKSFDVQARCSSPAGSSRSSARSRRQPVRLGLARDDRALRRVGACCSRAFLVWESRTAEPLMPFSIFRLRTLVGANIAGVILGTALFAMFLVLTLYMQQVLSLLARCGPASRTSRSPARRSSGRRSRRSS